MSNMIELSITNAVDNNRASLLSRLSVLLYGLISYAIGCAGLFWLILAVGGLAPVSLSEFRFETTFMALAFNTGLILLFGIQHSVMAREGFKQWITRYIPASAERATYMLMSGLVTMTAIYFWQPLPGIIWSVENTYAQIFIWMLYAAGWSYLLVSTFVTNHFELMGLRQVYLYFINKPYSRLPFTQKYMYKYSRHPMMLGVLVGLWAVPVMSVTHFVMAVLFTLYMMAGIFLEERDLLKRFGETYRTYKQQIATFVPGIF